MAALWPFVKLLRKHPWRRQPPHFTLAHRSKCLKLAHMNEELRKHEIPRVATWSDAGAGIPALEIVAPAAKARIYALGGQLSHWQPSQ